MGIIGPPKLTSFDNSELSSPSVDDIWTRWSEHYRERSIDPHSICQDGIADPDRFLVASQKVLFVMREANDWPGGDIRQLLRDGPRFQVWHTIGRWAAGFLQGFPTYDSIDRYETIRDSLQQVASINLKKRTGGSSSDLAVINAYAWQDRELLKEQIAQIHPTTIVACGTFDALVWLLDLPVTADSPRSPLTLEPQGWHVIPWVHPSRCDNRKSYEELAEIDGKRRSVSNTR
jgi:hypothetical protein